MSDVTLDQIGHCPICRLELAVDDPLVICPAGHYKAFHYAWNQAWDEFDYNSDLAEALIAKLLKLNQADISPEEIEKFRTAALGDE